MADIQFNVPIWGDQGSVWPDGYYYVEGEAPVDAWDNKFNYEVSRVLKNDVVPRLNNLLEMTKGTTRPSTPEEGQLFWDIDGVNDDGTPQLDIRSEENQQWYTFATKTWVQSNASSYDSDRVDGLHLDEFAMNRRTFHVYAADSSSTEYNKICKISDGSNNEQGGFRAYIVNANDFVKTTPYTITLTGNVRTSTYDIQHWTEGTRLTDGTKNADFIVTETAGTGANGENEYYLYVRSANFTDSVIVVEHANRFGEFDYQSNLESSEVVGTEVYNTETATESTESRYGPIYSEGDRVATRNWVMNNNTDADTLDGLDSSRFAIKDQNETITGNWSFDSGTSFGGSVELGANVDAGDNFINNVGRITFESDENDVIAMRDVTDGQGPPYTFLFNDRDLRFWSTTKTGEIALFQTDGDVKFKNGELETQTGWAITSGIKRRLYVGYSFPSDATDGDLLFEPV